MYHKVECVTLECDNCGEDFEEAHVGFSIFSDENQAHESADNDGWHLGDDHYCPKCYTVTDDDIVVVNAERTKPCK
jgi:uncharacterized protein (UPF0212 family)